MRKFTINGNEYEAKPFDFNMVCDMEDMGVALGEFGKKQMASMRAYFAICANRNTQFAGKEIEEHIIKGGTMAELATIMSEELEKSDFFQALNQKKEAKATKN